MATICYEKFKENAKELVKKSLNQETQYSLSERNNQVYLSVKQTILGESYKSSGLGTYILLITRFRFYPIILY